MAILSAIGQSNHQTYLPNGSWYVSEITFSSALVVGDTVVFFTAPLLGFRIADWFLTSDQLDTNVSPTLGYTVGILSSSKTALDSPLFSSWKIGSTISNSAAWSGIEKPSNGFHLAYDSASGVTGLGRNRGVGIIVTSAAATWAGNSKKMIMGLNLIPA
jgi:hypothetical protein